MNDLINKIHLGDCMDFLKRIPDKSIDLVLTDPPYGINYGKQLKGAKIKNGWRDWGTPEWDKERPKKEIFDEILRISRNQVIWGGELFCRYASTISRVACMGQRTKKFFACRWRIGVDII